MPSISPLPESRWAACRIPPRTTPLTPADLQWVDSPVMLAVGDRNRIAGTTDELRASSSSVHFLTLKNVGHTDTPMSPSPTDAAVQFLSLLGPPHVRSADRFRQDLAAGDVQKGFGHVVCVQRRHTLCQRRCQSRHLIGVQEAITRSPVGESHVE